MLSLSRLSGSYAPRILCGIKPSLRSIPSQMRPTGSYLLNRGNRNLQKKTFFTFVYQYQKGVTFTMGKLTSIKEPGIRVKLPFVQTMWKVDMRTYLENLEPQKVITRDNVTIDVDGVVQYKIVDPEKAICNIERVRGSLKELAQLKIREELSHRNMNDILHNREELGQQLLDGTQELTGDWGVELESIRIKDIIFDGSMTRAMAKRAEAERTAEAKMINAEADVRTAKK